MEKENLTIEEIHKNYLLLEKKVNETIVMVNQLIVNVNSSNQFVCNIHNALAQAGFCKSPEEIIKEIQKEKEKSKDAFEGDNEIIKEEMMDDIMGEPSEEVEDVNFTIQE